MGISKQLIIGISDEFAKRNNISNPVTELDGIKFHQVGKNHSSVIYLGYQLNDSYQFYKGYIKDNKLHYKEIYSMPIYIGDF